MEAFTDLFKFLMERKKWWLTPIVLVLLLLGVLIVMGGGSAVAKNVESAYKREATGLEMNDDNVRPGITCRHCLKPFGQAKTLPPEGLLSQGHGFVPSVDLSFH